LSTSTALAEFLTRPQAVKLKSAHFDFLAMVDERQVTAIAATAHLQEAQSKIWRPMEQRRHTPHITIHCVASVITGQSR
jgi:hypothetical protein